MADFVRAFREGQDAAEAADRARKEIDAVYTELNRQLRESTGGKIAIDRREFEVDRGWGMLLTWPPKPAETYLAIVAHNPCSEQHIKQLAKWSQSRGGYPCKIFWGSAELSCDDREALENALAELLRDPFVGEQLHTLLQMEPAPKESIAESGNREVVD